MKLVAEYTCKQAFSNDFFLAFKGSIKTDFYSNAIQHKNCCEKVLIIFLYSASHVRVTENL